MALVSAVNATTTVDIDTTTLNSTQHNVTFTIGINSSSISAGQAVRISYTITNLYDYCTYNPSTSQCDYQPGNQIQPQQIRIWFGENLTYQTVSFTLDGVRTVQSYFDMTVPSIDSACYDIKAELGYLDRDGSARFISSNAIQRGTCLARNTTNQPCYSYIHCQDGLFCLDSDNNSALDTCKASSTSYGYLCEQYGEGTKERISAIDGSCRFAYKWLQNRNLPDGSSCIYQADCISSYCWDSNGEGNTECNSATTAGNSTGIRASTPSDCSSSACWSMGKCYSNGATATVEEISSTCSNGYWQPVQPKFDINSTQHNVTFTIGINSSSISAGQAVRISYTITNLDPSCTKNFNTGGCDPITSNLIQATQIRIWFGENLSYQTISKTLYGTQSSSDYFDMIVPSNYSTCFDIKTELVYADVNDNSIARFISSNLIQRGTCLTRSTTDQSCNSYIHCQESLFCLDSDNNGGLDNCKASSTSYGYLCEQYGEGTKERISALDASCKFAYPGLQNRNLNNGMECIYRSDCVNNYCWDSNGDGNTECNSTTTAGNSTGIIASSTQDCSSSACFSNWKSYSNGSTVPIDFYNFTCQNGNLIAPAADIRAEYRNITYILTYVAKNSSHIIVNATFTNNESSAFGLNSTYFYIGDGANITRTINANLAQGQNETEQFIVAKPPSSPRYYLLYAESLIKNSTTYWWATSNLRCYDSVLDTFGEGETCYSIPPTYSLNSTNSTFAGRKILHSLNWTDNIALSGYIFSFDNGTGTRTNDTWTAFSGTWSNVTKTANSTVGTTIRWCAYANDTSDNWNGTSCTNPFSYVTTLQSMIITLNSNRTNSANQIVARPNSVILLYGRVYYVDGAVIPNTAIYFNYSTTVLGSNNTDSSGNYVFTFSIPYSGNYTLTATLTDAQGTTGYNTSVLYIASTPLNVKYRLSYHFGTSATNDVEKTGNYNETVDSLSVSRYFLSSDPNLAHAYTCTYDSTEYSAQLLSLIHSYQRNSLNYINFTANAALTDYTEEVSQKIAGSSLIIAYTKGTCSIIDNSMYLVESNQIPSRPFASFGFGIPSEISFLIQAKYDKIVINGSEIFGSGTNNMCIRKVAISSNYYPVELVKRC